MKKREIEFFFLGVEFSTQLFSGRCTVLTVLIFSFAIYQYYSASIMSSLLVEKPRTIRTVQDVINSSLDVGVEDIPYNRNYFEVVRSSSFPIYPIFGHIYIHY